MLRLDWTNLKTTSLQMLVPASEGKARAKALFHDWTQPPFTGKSTFSGYRRQILAGEGLSESIALANQLHGEFQNMIVLGIGGSALGSKTALAALAWTVETSHRRHVVICENLDPIEFHQQTAHLDPTKTCVVIISKSGGTIETMSQASQLLTRFQKSVGANWQKHFIAITDPKSGSLRDWCTKEPCIRNLSVPPDVGGRFSVLTPVGLIPLAFAGIDVSRLTQGAQKFFQGSVISLDEMQSFALRIWELEKSHFSGHVLMPYSSVLRDFGNWFVQLWGESLGKKAPNGGYTGSIPVAAVGATDQHSLLQLLVEGPNRLTTGFVEIAEWPKNFDAPTRFEKLPASFASLGYAEGKTFGQIINAELAATRQVLAERGRPSYTITLTELSPESIGALFAFYMDLTTWVGAHHEINPYDQPGVEHGKKILPTLLK